MCDHQRATRQTQLTPTLHATFTPPRTNEPILIFHSCVDINAICIRYLLMWHLNTQIRIPDHSDLHIIKNATLFYFVHILNEIAAIIAAHTRAAKKCSNPSYLPSNWIKPFENFQDASERNSLYYYFCLICICLHTLLCTWELKSISTRGQIRVKSSLASTHQKIHLENFQFSTNMEMLEEVNIMSMLRLRQIQREQNHGTILDDMWTSSHSFFFKTVPPIVVCCCGYCLPVAFMQVLHLVDVSC